MAEEDQRDPWWVPAPLGQPPQPRRAALVMALDGLKLEERVKAALVKAAGLLEAAGWHIEEVDGLPWREPARLQATMWLAEFRRTAGEAVEREADPDATFVYQQMARHCPDTDFNGFLDTLQRRATLARTWAVFLAEYPLIICPVSGELPFPDLLDLESPESFDRVFEAMLPQISTPFLGLPGLSVAMGLEDGNVPTGVQLIAGRFREDTLLEAGATIEAQIGAPEPVDPVTKT